MRLYSCTPMSLFSPARLCLALCLAAHLPGALSPAAAGDFPELQGRYAITAPQYDGVDHLLVLSDRWLVVVTSTLDEMVDEIDRLSGGQMRPAVESWDRTKALPGPDWAAFNTVSRLGDLYTAKARLNIREDLLDRRASYAISSTTDTRYRTPRQPRRVGRTLVGTGDNRITGGPDVDYYHYSYINLPEPMSNHNRYTITVQGRKSVSFRFNPNHVISRAIKINQVGYLTDAPRKIAYLGCHIYGIGPMDCSYYPEFHIVNTDTSAVEYAGKIRLREKDAKLVRSNGTTRMLNGEDVYEMDFSDFKKEGNFIIRIPGVGRSWPFKVGKDVYGEAFYTSARGLYHQRCGSACEEPYSRWPRIRCHTEPVYESDLVAFPIGDFEKPGYYDRFDIIGATLDESKPNHNVTGGWHDAADWDRNSIHYTVLFDLLYAYELAPEKFTDGQLNIPESGNGIPDVLDEAEYGLTVWARSMNKDGGVSGFVETNTHPKIDGDSKYAFSRRTRWDSLQFAAAAAQLAEHLMPFDSVDGQRWLWRAREAYSFGDNPANSLGRFRINAREDRGEGRRYTIAWEEKDEFIAPFLLHARVRLYRVTGQDQYLADWEELLSSMRLPFQWPYTRKDYAPWIYYAVVSSDPGVLSESRRQELTQEALLDNADELVQQLEEMPYRRSWDRNAEWGMAWGMSDMTNAGRMLFIAYSLTGDEAYRDAGILNVDFMFGANPMGMSWTTGIGYTYPVNIQHGPSMYDDIADPVPGITLYGVNGGMYSALRDQVWNSPGGILGTSPIEFKVPEEIPVWRTWSCHPYLNVSQCEFTVQETMSSTIFCTGFLMEDGWKPSAALKARDPRPAEALHGYFYLP